MSHDLELVTREVDFDVKALHKVLANIKEVIRIIHIENWEHKHMLRAKIHGVAFLSEEIYATVGEYLENNCI